MLHRITTTDPISLKDIDDTEGKPYLVEGSHYNDLTIYFENEDNLRRYEDIPIECPGRDFKHQWDNPDGEGFAEG